MPTVYTPPVSTYVPLASIELTSTDSEIVFSDIPATYRDLVLVATFQNQTSTNHYMGLWFNGDTANNYIYVHMNGGGSGSGGSGTGSGAIFIAPTHFTSNSQGIAHIMDYSASDKHTTVLGRADIPNSMTVATAGRWANTAAVHTVTVTTTVGGVYGIGSTFSLFGIQA